MPEAKGLPASIWITDQLGRQLFTQQINAFPKTTLSLLIEELPNGFYSLTIQVADRKRLTRNFIVHKLY